MQLLHHHRHRHRHRHGRRRHHHYHPSTAVEIDATLSRQVKERLDLILKTKALNSFHPVRVVYRTAVMHHVLSTIVIKA